MRTANAMLLAGVTLLASADCGLAAAGEAFTTLSVSASDPDGDPLTYRWEVAEYNGQPYNPATHPPVTFDGVYPDSAKVDSGRTAGFSAAGSYRLRVTVSDGAASASDSSLVVTVNPPGSPPPAPSNLAATTVSSSRIDLAWTDNATNETGFKIERAQGLGTLTVTLKTYNGANTAPTVQAAGSANSFKVGALVVNDRPDTWTSVPAGLSGKARLLTARNDRMLAPVAGKYVVTVSGPCTLYLPLDPRYGGAKLSWMDTSWADSGLTCNSSASSNWKIWKKSVAAAGDVTLGCDEQQYDGVCYVFEAGASYIQVATVGANVTSHADTGLAAATTYTYRVRATNAAGESGYSNEASATTLSGPPDTTPPVLSGEAATGVTDTSATIGWTTDEPSDSQLEYGSTTAYGFSTPVNAALVTGHGVGLSGLAPATLYHYRVKSRDAAGNLATGADFTFTTTAANLPPQITSAPWANPNPVTLPSTTAVSVAASDPDGGPSALTFTWSKVSGPGAVTFTPNGTTSADSSTASFSVAGTYVLRVTVSDGAGSVSGDVPVTVNPDPNVFTVTIASVASGKTYQVVDGGLAVGAVQYIDRTYTLSAAPASVQGRTYVKTANDDKHSTAASFLSLTVSANATVYVAHDNRLATKPSWLSGWVDTGENLAGGGGTFSLFKKDFAAGTVTLGGNVASGTPDCSMYNAVVARAP